METKNTLAGVGLFALLVGLSVGYIVGAGISEEAQQNTGTTAGEIDRHFIEQMLPHHEGAITMAEVALERSADPQVRTLANNIIATQNQESEEMRQWYQEWFGNAPPQGPAGHGGHGMANMQGMEGDLEALENAENFDQEFARQMIIHHEMAIMMAQMLAASTEHAQMKQLAENIIAAQTSEIEMMRQW